MKVSDLHTLSEDCAMLSPPSPNQFTVTGGSCWGTVWSTGLPHCGGAERMAHAEASEPCVAEVGGHHTGATSCWSAPLDRQLCPPLWFHFWFPSLLCPHAICLLWSI